jgi:hypothetical protein
MVQEILKNIEKKVEERLLKVEKEKEQAILSLEKKYDELLKRQKEKNLQAFRQKIDSDLQEFSQKKKLESEFAVLKERNRIVDSLYEEAKKDIREETLKKLVVSLFPKEADGNIRAGKRTAGILRQITSREITPDLEEEGFVIIGESADLDFRISEILDQLKQESKPELIKLLFS